MWPSCTEFCADGNYLKREYCTRARRISVLRNGAMPLDERANRDTQSEAYRLSPVDIPGESLSA